MTREEYEKEKNDIFLKSDQRKSKIMAKYKDTDGDGLLDGEPWAKEMHENSKRTLEELKQLDKKYAENN